MFRPVISAAVPDGWHIRAGLDYSDPDGRIRVAVFEEPVPPEFTTEQYARAYGELFAGHFPGYREIRTTLDAVSLGGLACVTRRLRWQPTDGRALVQTQVYSVVAGRGVVATASGAEADFAERHDQIDAALALVTVGPIRLVSRSPAATAAATTPERFDAGQLVLEPAGQYAVDEPELQCSIDELAAFARACRVDGYPGVADPLASLDAAVADQRLVAARRSLRARGLVELSGERATVAPAASMLGAAFDAEFMLTVESRDAQSTEKRVWFGAGDRYLQLVAIDAALVRISWQDRPAIVEAIEVDLRTAAQAARSGQVAWLGRKGSRFDGAAIDWQGGEDGSVTETGPAAADGRYDSMAFARRVVGAISWPA